MPNADHHRREYQALRQPNIVHGAEKHELLTTGAAKLTVGVENTAGKQSEVDMSVLLVRSPGRNLVSSSLALASGLDTTISAFPLLIAKGENVPLRVDYVLYILDVILPELPREYVNVEDTSNVMVRQRRLGHVNTRSLKKLKRQQGTGIM